MKPVEPIQIDLVLLGGGHAQVAVLKSFGMRPVPGLRITLVTDVLLTPYSGMLPACIEGVWRPDEMHIDLVRLAQFAGARLIHARCAGINPVQKKILFQDRPAIGYDVLSINSGAAPALSEIDGADTYGIPVKPISRFMDQLKAAGAPKSSIALIGGGAAAVELALALRSYYKLEHNCKPDIHVISRSKRLMPHFPERAHQISLSAFKAANIIAHFSASAEKFDEAFVHISGNKKIAANLKFIVTAAKAPEWLKETGLPLDEDGYIEVKDTLQTIDNEDIFSAGDVASIRGYKREKAGVFAVRSGPILAHNLRAYITGKTLKHHRPQSRYLALIGLADGTAIAVRGRFALRARFFGTLKSWIDQRFIEKFTDLPEMPVAQPEKLALAVSKTESNDPIFEPMRCLGCGAKTGPDTLKQALLKACELAKTLGADPAYLPDISTLSDSAVFQIPDASPETEWVQSVDSLSQMIGDPFLFGRISALHALSDIFVAAGTPITALAQIQLGFAREEIQQDALISMLSGALIEFSQAKVKLVGGHTSEGQETSCGFSVLGVKQSRKTDDHVGIHKLILSKPLGTGMALAAQMRGAIGAQSYDAALTSMLQSNQQAASVLRAHGAEHMTDVTGFGLARHCQSLIANTEYLGAEIWIDKLPSLSRTETILKLGIYSSLHQINAKNLPIAFEGSDNRYELLFDPQTSGGVLALVPQVQASDSLIELQKAGYHQAAIIGQTTETKGLTVYTESQER